MYTSRPALKGLIRVLEAILHESEALYAAAALGAPGPQTELLPAIGYARATNGVMTHHDAITGTAYYTCVISPPGDCDCYGAFPRHRARVTIILTYDLVAASDM